MLLGQGSVLNDVLALRGHSEVPDNDELHTFLMTHIGDPDDPQLDKEENGPIEQAAFANQPQQSVCNKDPFSEGACFDFISKGKCERGAECKFCHSSDDGCSHIFVQSTSCVK